jgi:hypothetical protein
VGCGSRYGSDGRSSPGDAAATQLVGTSAANIQAYTQSGNESVRCTFFLTPMIDFNDCIKNDGNLR